MCEPGLRTTQSVMQYGVATEERGRPAGTTYSPELIQHPDVPPPSETSPTRRTVKRAFAPRSIKKKYCVVHSPRRVSSGEAFLSSVAGAFGFQGSRLGSRRDLGQVGGGDANDVTVQLGKQRPATYLGKWGAGGKAHVALLRARRPLVLHISSSLPNASTLHRQKRQGKTYMSSQAYLFPAAPPAHVPAR